MTTLNGWQITTVNRLLIELPLQDYDSALLLVSTYLSSVGGWVPVDPDEPTGEGMPASGLNPVEAAFAIRDQQYARMYEVDAEVTIKIRGKFVANLPPSQDDAVVLAQLSTPIETFVNRLLDGTALEVVSTESVTGTVTAGGKTTAQQRIAMQSAVAAGNLTSPLTIAVDSAREAFGLDSHWNAHAYFSEADKSIAVVIRKYTTTSYASLDAAEAQQCIFCVAPETHQIVSGSKIVIPD